MGESPIPLRVEDGDGYGMGVGMGWKGEGAGEGTGDLGGGECAGGVASVVLLRDRVGEMLRSIGGGQTGEEEYGCRMGFERTMKGWSFEVDGGNEIGRAHV